MGLLLKFIVETNLRIKMMFETRVELKIDNKPEKFDFTQFSLAKREQNNRAIRCTYLGDITYLHTNNAWWNRTQTWVKNKIAITNLGLFRFDIDVKA